MGVRGLTSFIAENSEACLQPLELCDTLLVIDGNNVACYLYRELSQSHSAFGGDYDEYYETTAGFFSVLIKCGVKPIVLLDGGHEKRKLKSLLSRAFQNLGIVRNFAKRFTTCKFIPLFLQQTFIDVLIDMNIIYIKCDFEADTEIAAVARALNCPILSHDSDFYIFDALYIPLPTVTIKAIQYPGSKRCFVRCSIFSCDYFFKEFSGLDKSHLPLLATLLGNDYIESSLFSNFFNHVLLPKSKRLSYTQRKVRGVLNWLKKESVESAINLILSHVGNKNAGKVLSAIKLNKRSYSSNFVSGAVLDKLTSQLGDVKLEKNVIGLNWPKEVIKFYSQSKIHNFVMDMFSLRIYFTKFQVENVYNESSHFPALPLIQSIYTLLIPYMEHPSSLKLYLSVKNHYRAIKIENDPNSFLSNVCLDDILKESKEERLKWLCSIVGVEENFLTIVSNNNWSIFLMSYIYWVKKLKNSVTSAHVRALVLMVVANEVVQKYVGYFRTYQKFIKNKKSLLNDKKRNIIVVGKQNNFNAMLEQVPFFEKVMIHGILLPYRQTTEKGSNKEYDISVLHLFGCFQSCLYHIMQLNVLLNYPLPHCKVRDFYSGTLLFNFYLIAKTKPNFTENLLKDLPNLATVFTYLCETFCQFLNGASPEIRKLRKKRNKKKDAKSKTEEEEEKEVIYETERDILDYKDENNQYAVLQNVN